ncbi:hypothetical protein GGTG_13256 [Gaeumannomyces tritici R3-111a-1]|uniref:Uncharacterized protein n=1 Tax=Gaeumannomyces tritici (strain R3-111a-1) TaxID=644352 RepID=J3PIC8_GAET3|nr:hypothetical protein GGTG_13256 [Gaeumannomyces tritici R3-111a-1]EJT69147.1 hypothetical protein GGTG_13256 [Gaeumannomyces tritici R3-111a-1]
MPAYSSQRYSFRRGRQEEPFQPLNSHITLSSDSSTLSSDDEDLPVRSQAALKPSQITLGTPRPISPSARPPSLEPGYDPFLEATQTTAREPTPSPSEASFLPDFQAEDVFSTPPTSEQAWHDPDDLVEPVDRPVPGLVRDGRAGRGETWSPTQELRFLQLLAEAARAGQMNPQIAN